MSFVLDAAFLEAGLPKQSAAPPPEQPRQPKQAAPFSLEALQQVREQGGTRPSTTDLRTADRRDTAASGVHTAVSHDEDAIIRAMGSSRPRPQLERDLSSYPAEKKKQKRGVIGAVVTPSRKAPKPSAGKNKGEAPPQGMKLATKKAAVSMAEQQQVLTVAKEASAASSAASSAMTMLRTKAAAHLKATLFGSDGSFGFTPEDCEAVSREVEAAVCRLCGGGGGEEGEGVQPSGSAASAFPAAEYRRKCRSLSFNLKTEASLVTLAFPLHNIHLGRDNITKFLGKMPTKFLWSMAGFRSFFGEHHCCSSCLDEH